MQFQSRRAVLQRRSPRTGSGRAVCRACGSPARRSRRIAAAAAPSRNPRDSRPAISVASGAAAASAVATCRNAIGVGQHRRQIAEQHSRAAESPAAIRTSRSERGAGRPRTDRVRRRSRPSASTPARSYRPRLPDGRPPLPLGRGRQRTAWRCGRTGLAPGFGAAPGFRFDGRGHHPRGSRRRRSGTATAGRAAVRGRSAASDHRRRPRSDLRTSAWPAPRAVCALIAGSRILRSTAIGTAMNTEE